MRRLLVCLTVLLALSGCGDATKNQEPLASNGPATGPAQAVAHEAPQTQVSKRVAPTAPTVPTRLRLGDIDAQVVPLDLDGTTLTPPDDPQVLGWWGKPAGAPHGTTLLTGHTVHDGGGKFDDLEHTRLGATARVNGHSYEVDAVQVISKEQLAERAPKLFTQSGSPRLVLVTCEDYNPVTHHYASNVVVTLTPVG